MKKRGFTLVELLAVIAILAVILIVAVPKVNNYIMSSKKGTFINNALNIARQLEYDNMDFITFDKAYIKDFELEKLNRNDIDVNNSLVYVENNEIYIDLVGIGSYEGFYVCHVNSESKNVTVQNTECGTSPDGLIYIDFEVDLDGGETTQEYNNQYVSGNYLNLMPPKKYDLTFLGWEVVNGDSIISGNRIKFGTEATSIKAIWKTNPTLTVKLDGGTTTQTFEKKYPGGTSIILKVPTREGYIFTGWELVSGNSILSGNTLTIGSEDTVVKANWVIGKININYNLDGGTFENDMPTQAEYGSTIILENPSKEGYVFAGWIVSGNNTILSANNLTIGDGDVTLTSEWAINAEFSYTGGEQTYTATTDGYYKLEVWGAQGGGNGGYGGYSLGKYFFEKNDSIYIYVGGVGARNPGGYNGGGAGQYQAGSVINAAYGGGGATHISKEIGMLSSLSKYENNHDSPIIIVAGAGGGSGENSMQGGHAGGFEGNAGTGTCYVSSGGSQTSGGAAGAYDSSNGGFGYGGDAAYGTTNSGTWGAGGGGSGYYGGGGNSFSSGSDCAGGGAGGSSYIGNQLLTDKYMYCYNCATSDAVDTKTYTTKCAEETPTENCAKKGNGYAKITFVGKTLSE